MLGRQKERSWHDVVTLDESWFYLNTAHELIWLQPDEEAPERELHIIQSPKLMLTIAWNPNGFHLIDVLPKGFKFNASYYISHILGPLSVWRQTQVGRTNRKLIIHSDNARSHTARATSDFMDENAMTRAPHPPYSPDLASSDF
jgi:histone-lysine N-methyltransferase SETMAR